LLELDGAGLFMQSLAISADGRFMGWPAAGGVNVWDFRTGEMKALDRRYLAGRCAFSPDSKVFTCQHTEGPLRRWRTDDWRKLPGRWGVAQGPPSPGVVRRFPLGCLAYRPDGAVLASAFGFSPGRETDSEIILWDAATGEERGSLRPPSAPARPTDAAFSPDGRSLAVLHGPQLRVWDVERRAELAVRRVGNPHFRGLTFVPDGSRLVTVSNDRTVRLWDVTTWSEVGRYEWDVGKLQSVAVSPDGMRMAAGGHTGKVVVWDVD
jgi:WD40 repeat protein